MSPAAFFPMNESGPSAIASEVAPPPRIDLAMNLYHDLLDVLMPLQNTEEATTTVRCKSRHNREVVRSNGPKRMMIMVTIIIVVQHCK